MEEPPVTTEEVHAALEARKDLGRDYERQIADSLAERIERRLEERQVERRPAADDPSRGAGPVVPIALGSIALGIPVTAVATSNAHGGGGIAVAIVAWIAIALVNLAHGFRRR